MGINKLISKWMMLQGFLSDKTVSSILILVTLILFWKIIFIVLYWRTVIEFEIPFFDWLGFWETHIILTSLLLTIRRHSRFFQKIWPKIIKQKIILKRKFPRNHYQDAVRKVFPCWKKRNYCKPNSKTYSFHNNTYTQCIILW